jgi:hypothetical protein
MYSELKTIRQDPAFAIFESFMSLVVNEKLGGLINSHFSSSKLSFNTVKQTIMRFLNSGHTLMVEQKDTLKKQPIKIFEFQLTSFFKYNEFRSYNKVFIRFKSNRTGKRIYLIDRSYENFRVCWNFTDEVLFVGNLF